MRTQGPQRGDGPPTGVHLPVTDRRHRFATERNNGPRIRRGHGKFVNLLEL